MKRIVLQFAALMLFLSCGTKPQLVKLSPFQHAERILVAVLPFESSGERDSILLAIIASSTGEMIEEIKITGRYRVIERQRIEAVLQEQSLQLSGFTEEPNTAEIGKLLGADAVVISEVGDIRFRKGRTTALIAWINKQEVEAGLNSRIVDCRTGEVLASASSKIVVKEKQWVAFGFAKIGGMEKKEDLIARALSFAIKETANRLGEKAVKK